MNKSRLWQVEFRNQAGYWGDWDKVTINAPNAKCAMQKAISHFKGMSNRRLHEITEVKQLAKED